MTIRPVGFGALCLGLVVCACGGDDDKKVVPDEVEAAAGAPAVVSFPPALGPQDCVASTSELTLSQPNGAAVWGGLVLLEFEVEGAKVDTFDIQLYDPALGAWVNNYVSQNAAGQRDDGSYFVAITPTFNDANKDQELKVRIRPTQQGCPEADWTESNTFTASDPIVGTTWSGVVPSELFNSQLNLQRTSLLPEPVLFPLLRMAMGDATLSVEFGAQGALTETLSFSLESEEDAGYHGCTINLTFSGTYELILRQQYGGLMLAISDQVLTSFEDTICELPAVAEMAVSAEDFDARISAYTQGVSINYLPTLYSEPGVPTWSGNQLAHVFEQLLPFLAYTTDTEQAYVSGYLYPLDLSLEQQ